MLLSEVAAALDVHEIANEGDPVIVDVTHDSRQVVAGSLFCCLPGAIVDGHDFADRAVEAGAVALLCERPMPLAVPQIVVPDARTAMAFAAAAQWGHPARDMHMVGVTGTNGKTTTVSMVAAISELNERAALSIGTLGGARTTPESSDLQRVLAEAYAAGTNTVAMEVSSHALVAHRVDGIVYDVAAFTNLSHEHLDFHKTMEEYFLAKAILFSPEHASRAVICVDDEWGSRLAGLAEDRGLPVVRCSVNDAVIEGFDGRLTTFRWHGAVGSLQMAGRHNISNAVVAANIAELLGLTAQQALDGLAALPSVPGRFEAVNAGQPFLVIVDYAHTPGALEVALDAARTVVQGNGVVRVVVGCGGEKDRAKRPLMAAVCESMADSVVLTSDNPRHEDPRAILEEMQTGLRDPAGVLIEPDRASAIRTAIAAAAPGDVVLIAGKGHETTQTIGDDVLPFDDRVVARGVLEELGYAG